MAFGDTLEQIASFGASIGSTVDSTYQAVNYPTSYLPPTNIPSSFATPAPAPKMSSGETLLLIGLAVLAIFGFSRFRKPAA